MTTDRVWMGMLLLAPALVARVIVSGLEGALLLDRVDGGQQRLDAQRRLIAELVE